MEIITIKKGNFTTTTDKLLLDLSVIHDYLAKESYWSRNIPFETLKKAVDNSLNFGLFHQQQQIGFARVVSDFATVAYLNDVFVLSDFRGQGLSKWLLETLMAHPALQGLRRWILLTADAHELYKKYGWTSPKNPDRYMEKHNPIVYQQFE